MLCDLAKVSSRLTNSGARALTKPGIASQVLTCWSCWERVQVSQAADVTSDSSFFWLYSQLETWANLLESWPLLLCAMWWLSPGRMSCGLESVGQSSPQLT